MANKKRVRKKPVWQGLKPGTLVEILWLDALFDLEPDKEDRKKYQKQGGCLVKTVGYIDKADKNGISSYNELFEDGSFRGWTIVPTGMILNVRKL